jgi:hypothetical protein
MGQQMLRHYFFTITVSFFLVPILFFSIQLIYIAANLHGPVHTKKIMICLLVCYLVPLFAGITFLNPLIHSFFHSLTHSLTSVISYAIFMYFPIITCSFTTDPRSRVLSKRSSNYSKNSPFSTVLTTTHQLVLFP